MSLIPFSSSFWAVVIFATISIAIQFILAGLMFKRYQERKIRFILYLDLTLLCYATGAIFAVCIQLIGELVPFVLVNNLLFVLSSAFFLNFCLMLFYDFTKNKNIKLVVSLLLIGSIISIIIIPFAQNPYLAILFGIVSFLPYIILLQNAVKLKKKVDADVKSRFTSMQVFPICFLTGSTIFFINSTPLFGIDPAIQALLYILTWFFDTIGWVAIYLGFIRKVKSEKIENK
jgi:hypothetical protein